MIRTQSAAFRTQGGTQPPSVGPIGATIFDVATWATVARTPGATVIDAIQFQPLPSERWTVLGYSVKASLYLSFTTPNSLVSGVGPGFAGRLGKIRTSLVIGTDFASSTGSSGINQSLPTAPVLPFPADTTLATDLWNPAVDDLPPHVIQNTSPPIASLGNVGLPVSCDLTLPEPRPIQQAQQFGIGLWITPSIIAALGAPNPGIWILPLYNASYSIIYDDGH